VVSNIRGSGGTPGNLADTLRRGCGPAGIVIGYPDINIMTGIVVAERLYGTACPMFLADAEQRAAFSSGAQVRISQAGLVTFAQRAEGPDLFP
jgi:predicted aconitase with swiveling domain